MTNWKDRMHIFMQYQLRDVKDKEDFFDLLNTIKKSKVAFEIRSKRSGRRVFSFSEHINPEKCHYLIDDGVSVGICRWENLHRVLYIEED